LFSKKRDQLQESVGAFKLSSKSEIFECLMRRDPSGENCSESYEPRCKCFHRPPSLPGSVVVRLLCGRHSTFGTTSGVIIRTYWHEGTAMIVEHCRRPNPGQ